MLSDMKKPIHVAIGNLCLKAYTVREAALSKANMYLPPTPSFIVQLRQWRDDAKAKRQARIAKSNRSTAPLRHEQSGNPDVDQNIMASAFDTGEPSASMFADNNALLYPQQAFEPYAAGSGDPFYLFEGFDHGRTGTGMDFDFMLPDDYNMEESRLEPINWEQWDTWLADSNVMQS